MKKFWYWIIGIFLFLIWILFPYISEIGYGTDPEEILNNTYGKITYSFRTPLTFEEYYNLVVPEPAEFMQSYDNFSFALEIPKLEFNYSHEKEYLDYCEGKKVEINFTNPKYVDFEFHYEDNEFNYKVNLYKDLYEFSDALKEQDCYYRSDQYEEAFFKDPYNNQFVGAISKDFISLREKGFSDNEIVEIATVFVQSIPYGTDYTEFNRYPYETLYEKEGNCYDKSILLAGILKNLGYEVYVILGDSEEEYHAIVGLACEKGNMVYNSKNICFIETTVFNPIASESDIGVERFVEVSLEGKIYNEVNYGKQLSNMINRKVKEAEKILVEIDDLYYELLEIEEQMCETDCIICEETIIDIEYCDDAYKYNRLAREYNDLLKDYNPLIDNYYKVYYDLERDLFWNLEFIERD